jgi:hypothetical protein
MRYREAKKLITEEWDRWIERQAINQGGPTARESLKFFIELQDTRSPLLDFRSRRRDRWQVVHRWLLEQKRVADYRDTANWPDSKT